MSPRQASRYYKDGGHKVGMTNRVGRVRTLDIIGSDHTTKANVVNNCKYSNLHNNNGNEKSKKKRSKKQ